MLKCCCHKRFSRQNVFRASWGPTERSDQWVYFACTCFWSHTRIQKLFLLSLWWADTDLFLNGIVLNVNRLWPKSKSSISWMWTLTFGAHVYLIDSAHIKCIEELQANSSPYILIFFFLFVHRAVRLVNTNYMWYLNSHNISPGINQSMPSAGRSYQQHVKRPTECL